MLRLHCALFILLPAAAVADVVVPVESVEQHVNIRMTADAKSEIVGRLPQGEWRSVVGAIDGWYEVEIAGGATGFISADWTVLLDAPPEKKVEAVETERGDSADEVPVVAEDPGSVEAPVGAESEPGPAAESAAAADSGIDDSDDEKTDDPVPFAGVDAADTAGEDAAPQESTAETPVIAEATEALPVDESTDETPLTAESTDVPADNEAGESDKVAAVVEAEAMATSAQAESAAEVLPPGPTGPAGPPGPQGPPGPAGGANIEGTEDFLMKFTAPTIGGNSQVYDDGNHIGIGTTAPKQRLEVNGNIQIHEQNSSVAGLMITQSDGETGYIMHNRASTLTIGAGSVDRITIDRQGNIGFGTARPAYPLELANGAHVTDGGVWTNASSRELKDNIVALGSAEALQALEDLEPMRFTYKNDRSDDYVGFIAEDVPALVASGDRKGLSAMDIVAVLTRVVQDQQKKIEELEAKLDQR